MGTSAVVPVAKAAGKQVSRVLDYGIRSGWKVLENMGEPGKLLSEIFHSQQSNEAIMSGGIKSEIETIWSGVDAATRLAAKTNSAPVVNQLTQQRQQAASIFRELSNRGAKVVDPTTGKKVPISMPKDFFPQVLKDSTIDNSKTKNELIDFLVSTNQAPHKGAAEDAIEKLHGMQYGRNGYEVMFNMKGIQIPDKFMESDPKVAFAMWGDTASRFVTKADLYGPKDVNIESLKGAIYAGDNGAYNKEVVKDIIAAHEYGYSRGTGGFFYEGKGNVERTITAWEGLTKLGRISIAESTQGVVNIPVLTNIKSMLRGASDIASDRDSAIDFALKSGALGFEALRDWKAAVHGRGAFASMFHYTGFDKIRQFNLVLAANSGKNYAMELADKLMRDPANKEALTMLPIMGINPASAVRGLSPDDLLMAGQKVASLTQFAHNPLNLPIMWGKNPFMRTLTMYKSFVYNQTKFGVDYGIKTAYKAGKLPQNLAYLTLVAPLFGELVGDAEMLAQGRNPNERVNMLQKSTGIKNDAVARYLENLTRVGHMAMFFSVLSSFNRDNITGWLGGPVVGDIEDANRVVRRLAKGGKKNREYATKSALKRIPVVGAPLANTIYKEKK